MKTPINIYKDKADKLIETYRLAMFNAMVALRKAQVKCKHEETTFMDNSPDRSYYECDNCGKHL